MNASGFRGSMAGIPVRGGIVNINSADAEAIINSASGLIRTTADVVSAGVHAAGKGLLMGGLALGLLTLLFNGLSSKESPRVPIQSLARIRVKNRDFLGICTSEFIECDCGGHRLKIPTQSINKIKDSCYGGAFTLILEGYNISLIDGSLYTNCMPITNQLSFLTLAGEQRVVIFRTEREGFLRKQSWSPYRPKDSEVSVDMKGATAKDVGDLRQRLVFAFENSMEKIIETIGKEQFSKYFVISE